ncbi:glycosyltransferase [Maribacter halichondriae]|uniref:glycosyltransferase n=1 Tax=Maribacter halichondriae TaxID=2980554 RepID=UPI0023582536|nr:glycosyltransferase [Maribacter sp. Hal144]
MALKDVEIIVALSGTTNDGSHELKMPIPFQYVNCADCGRALQMNEAAQLARGETMVFLHADVIPPKTFLADIQRTIAEGYDAGFFSYRYDKENFLLKINASFTARNGIFTGGGDQCLFIRKSIFERLKGFDENQVVMEDFEFFERMKKDKVRYKIIKNDLIVSARKYEHNSYMRVNLSNLLLVTLFKFGYPAHKLKSLHNKLIRTPYQNPS